jgi:hypothetical protein
VPASGAARLETGRWLGVILNIVLPVLATAAVLWYLRRVEPAVPAKP